MKKTKKIKRPAPIPGDMPIMPSMMGTSDMGGMIPMSNSKKPTMATMKRKKPAKKKRGK